MVFMLFFKFDIVDNFRLLVFKKLNYKIYCKENLVCESYLWGFYFLMFDLLVIFLSLVMMCVYIYVYVIIFIMCLLILNCILIIVGVFIYEKKCRYIF